MKILLIDEDKTSFPNLALMKISAYYKSKGCDVGFNIKNPDKIFVSSIFSSNNQSYIYNCPIEYGGTGYDINKKLDKNIEHICPDYDLYNINYSMGFTSRGCINNCSFCIVPEKEGFIKDHASITEFLRHDKLILLDNSFLESPNFIKNSIYLIENKIKTNINQGIDVRRIDEEKAQLLSSIPLYNHQFTSKALFFAWDYPQHEQKVRKGIELLLNNGLKPYMLYCYVLVGYNTTHEQDYHRVMTLWNDYHIYPFVMRYNKRKDDRYLMDLSRWCNNRQIFKSCSFEEYLEKKKIKS